MNSKKIADKNNQVFSRQELMIEDHDNMYQIEDRIFMNRIEQPKKALVTKAVNLIDNMIKNYMGNVRNIEDTSYMYRKCFLDCPLEKHFYGTCPIDLSQSMEELKTITKPNGKAVCMWCLIPVKYMKTKRDTNTCHKKEI